MLRIATVLYGYSPRYWVRVNCLRRTFEPIKPRLFLIAFPRGFAAPSTAYDQ